MMETCKLKETLYLRLFILFQDDILLIYGTIQLRFKGKIYFKLFVIIFAMQCYCGIESQLNCNLLYS